MGKRQRLRITMTFIAAAIHLFAHSFSLSCTGHRTEALLHINSERDHHLARRQLTTLVL